MKLYAKILPKYFEAHKRGDKSDECRQFESMVLIHSETGEEIEFDVRTVIGPVNKSFIRRQYPDIEWNPDKPIFQIKLGRRV